MEGHLLAPMLEERAPEFPFVALLVSGGHSMLVRVDGIGSYQLLGESIDDAAGEAFDKTAKLMGLDYPGGPLLSRLAEKGTTGRFTFPRPMTDRPGLDMSFSGLKTAVLNEVNQAQMKGTDINVPDLAASFQERIAGILAEKLLLAAADTGAKQVCLAGGVAANGRLRQLVNDGAQKLGAKVYLPELKFCGDNGAMIAAQGYYQYIAGHTAGLELNGLPTLPIDYE
jgi:N6-L-threonylcarbamoyladenine synthase